MPSARFETEWGPGWLHHDESSIVAVSLPGTQAATDVAPPNPEIEKIIMRLQRYLATGQGWENGVSLAERASTPLLRDIYRRVCAIPPGRTITYAGVAADVGRPGAARAVGAAMAANQFAPFVPCHRVVGSDGSLRGYAGGLDMKRTLLAREGAS